MTAGARGSRSSIKRTVRNNSRNIFRCSRVHVRSLSAGLISKPAYLKRIQTLMGHRNIETTLNVYGHLIERVVSESQENIGTIIRRESHWQSRVLRNDRHQTFKPRGIRSLSGQPAQRRSLTGGSNGIIESETFYNVISETYWRTGGDSNSR